MLLDDVIRHSKNALSGLHALHIAPLRLLKEAIMGSGSSHIYPIA